MESHPEFSSSGGPAPLSPDQYETCPLRRLTIYEFDDTFGDRLIRFEDGVPPRVVEAGGSVPQPCHHLPATRKYVERAITYHRRAFPDKPFDPRLVSLLKVD